MTNGIRVILGIAIVLALLVVGGFAGWYGSLAPHTPAANVTVLNEGSETTDDTRQAIKELTEKVVEVQETVAAHLNEPHATKEKAAEKKIGAIEPTYLHLCEARAAFKRMTLANLRMLYYTNRFHQEKYYEVVNKEFKVILNEMEGAKRLMLNLQNKKYAENFLAAATECKKQIDEWWDILGKIAAAGAVRKDAYDTFCVEIDRMIAMADKANAEAAKANDGNIPEAMLKRYAIHRDLRDQNRRIAMDAYLYMRSNDPPVRKHHAESWIAGIVCAIELLKVIENAEGTQTEVLESVKKAEDGLKNYQVELNIYLKNKRDQDACVVAMEKTAAKAEDAMNNMIAGVVRAAEVAKAEAMKRRNILFQLENAFSKSYDLYFQSQKAIYSPLRKFLAPAKDEAAVKELEQQLLKMKTEYLAWRKSLAEAVFNNEAEVAVHIDGKTSPFGKWYYAEDFKEVKAEFPEVARIFERLASTHLALHASAAKIQKEYRKMHPGLIEFLKIRLEEHDEWMDLVDKAIRDEAETIDVQTDPAKSAFGKWLNSEECFSFQADYPEFAQYVKEVKEPHKDLHQSVAKINATQDKAERAKIFEEETVPAFKQFIENTMKMIAVEDELTERHKIAEAILEKETHPLLEKFLPGFDHAQQKLRE